MFIYDILDILLFLLSDNFTDILNLFKTSLLIDFDIPIQRKYIDINRFFFHHNHHNMMNLFDKKTI